MTAAEDAANTVNAKAAMDTEMAMSVNASGGAVKVDFPADLASFPELTGGAAA